MSRVRFAGTANSNPTVRLAHPMRGCKSCGKPVCWARDKGRWRLRDFYTKLWHACEGRA